MLLPDFRFCIFTIKFPWIEAANFIVDVWSMPDSGFWHLDLRYSIKWVRDDSNDNGVSPPYFFYKCQSSWLCSRHSCRLNPLHRSSPLSRPLLPVMCWHCVRHRCPTRWKQMWPVPVRDLPHGVRTKYGNLVWMGLGMGPAIIRRECQKNWNKDSE